MLPSVCRLYRKDRLLAACYRNTSLSKSPTSARSARVRPPHVLMRSRIRPLVLSCRRPLMKPWPRDIQLSRPLVVMLPCSRSVVNIDGSWPPSTSRSAGRLIYCSLALGLSCSLSCSVPVCPFYSVTTYPCTPVLAISCPHACPAPMIS